MKPDPLMTGAGAVLQGYGRSREAISHGSLVSSWLFLVAALVFAMIAVGGATRLTDSGLSITEWQPIIGAIPPLSEADWQTAFAKYQQTTEYHLVNKGMSLAAFKTIFWWEWTHRLLGRLIGLAFALPLAGFWLAGWLPRRLAMKLLGVLLLGALQGFIGWYMVKSGLADRIDVSQYRLALHLFMAFLILGLLLWLGIETASARTTLQIAPASRAERALAALVAGAVLLQVVLGALVAGLKAGLTYNTWPLMDGRLVPSGLGALEPWWLNVFENVTTVQFNHRLVAYALLILVGLQAVVLARSRSRAGSTAFLLLLAVLAQAGLGIWTLLAAVPLPLGLAHQAGAAAVFALAVWHLARVFALQR